MRRLLPLICALILATLAVPAPAAESSADDLLMTMEAEATYNGAAIMDAVERALIAIETELSGEPEGDNAAEIRTLLTDLGFMHLAEMQVFAAMGDDGFTEEFDIAIDPAGAETPLGHWFNRPPTDSTLPGRLASDDYIMWMTMSDPGGNMTSVHEIAAAAGAPMHHANDAAGGDLLPPGGHDELLRWSQKFERLFAGADAVHGVLYDIDPALMSVNGAVIVEYDDSPTPFTEAFVSYTEGRQLTWNTEDHDGVEFHILQSSEVPMPLTWAVVGRTGYFATNPTTMADTLEWATPDGGSSSDLIMTMEFNLGKLRDRIPSFAMDMLASEMGKDMPGSAEAIETFKTADLGTIAVSRVAKPNTLSLELSASRGLMVAYAELYEQMIVAMMIDAARSNRGRRQDGEADNNARSIQIALERYALAHDGAYPRSLSAITDGYLDVLPDNPYAGTPMRAISFENRAPGHITYIPLMERDSITGFQLLLYGREGEYYDAVDNNNLREDGGYEQTADGYEDLVRLVLTSEVEDWE